MKSLRVLMCSASAVGLAASVAAPAQLSEETLISAPTPLASAQSYSFIKLSPVSGRGGSVPEGINNAGQVVGWSFTSRLHDWRATLWNGTTPTDLGTMG